MKYNHTVSSLLRGTCLAFAIAAMTSMSNAALVTMTGTGDANTTPFTSSFINGTNWTGGAAPSAGNTYEVGSVQSIRTPTDGSTSVTFMGDSLTLNGSGAVDQGRLLYKGQSTAAITTTLNIASLILNGGGIENATNTNGSTMIIGGGVVNVTSASSINRSSRNGPVIINSTLTGNGMLTIGGQLNNGSSVTFNGVNTYTGNMVVTNAGGAGLILGALGSFNFAIGQSGISNNISATGVGSATFEGTFVMDLTNAAATGSWNIVSAATITEIYNSATFAVKDQLGNAWTQDNDVWTSPGGTYQFAEATGALTSIPEPSSLLLGAAGIVGAFARRRRVA
ncbi:MAG: PEP-CTERM sorting domain-containing protein [Verrucomicrobiota bacterium]